MATRPLVYITRRIPQKGVEVLLQDCDVKQWDSEQAAPKGELMYCVAGADAILCMPGDIIDGQVMDAAGPQLRVIATVSESTDHIVSRECVSRGIQVISCPLQPPQNLADLTVALVLLTIKHSRTDEEHKTMCQSLSQLIDLDTRDVESSVNGTNKIHSRPQLLRQMSEEQMAFQWSNGKPVNTNCSTWKTIAQKTFGVYGLSKTGISVAKLLKNLGIQCVLAADVDVKKSTGGLNESEAEDVFERNDCFDVDYYTVSFEELLSRCDIICVCGSVGLKSDKVFSHESFKAMKGDAILVTSQSEEVAIDYLALYEALRQGQIKAAGLNDCNQVACPYKTMFQGLENCVFLPQTQESVYDMRHKVSVIVARNLTCALKSGCLAK